MTNAGREWHHKQERENPQEVEPGSPNLRTRLAASLMETAFRNYPKTPPEEIAKMVVDHVDHLFAALEGKSTRTNPAPGEKILNVDRVRDLLHYDTNTGAFIWKAARGSLQAGAIAGSVSTSGYIRIKIDGRQYSAHRLAWFLCKGKWPDEMLDHVNGDPADNRIANLRECSSSENVRNIGLRANNQSGTTGVYAAGKKWGAQIWRHGERIRLGLFDEKEDAVQARLDAEKKYHGEFKPKGR